VAAITTEETKLVFQLLFYCFVVVMVVVDDNSNNKRERGDDPFFLIVKAETWWLRAPISARSKFKHAQGSAIRSLESHEG
jgi:hypothetical protein